MTDQATTPPAERPNLPALPVIVEPSAVDRESAVDAEKIAFDLLSALSDYLDDLTDCVEADPPVMDRDTLEGLDRIRRQVATVTDLIANRKYAATATEYAQIAARVVERIAGLALLAGERAGILDDPDEVFGRTASLLRTMGTPADEEFADALTYCRVRGDVGRQAMVDALAVDDLGAAAELQHNVLTQMAGDGSPVEAIARTLGIGEGAVRALAAATGVDLPAEERPADVVDVAGTVEAVIDQMELAAVSIARIPPGGLSVLPQAKAADLASSLFTHAKHVLALRAALLARAGER
jgi:hypothetical protein